MKESPAASGAPQGWMDALFVSYLSGTGAARFSEAR